jgi:hypothetical protein
MTATADILERLAPLSTPDLEEFTAAVASPLEQINFYVRDDGDDPGWSALLDVDRCPAEALPWLGQLVGVTLVPQQASETTAQFEARARQRIKDTDGWQRGTPAAIMGAIKAHLTGTQTVFLRERDGSAYRLTVVTFDDETPDTDAALSALIEQKPAGIVLTFLVVPHWVYEIVRLSYVTYDDILATFPTYRALLDDTPGIAGASYPGADVYPGSDLYPGG